MAAGADPVGNNNNQEGSSAVKSSSNGSNISAEVDTSQTESALRHNSGISTEWIPEEQLILEDLLAKFASDSAVNRYAKIAKQLEDKTVRDVALRCRWMTKKENGERRKEGHNSVRKHKDRKEKATDSSAKTSFHLAACPNGPSYAPAMIPMEADDGISFKAIDGVTGEILEQNSQMFNQISTNFATLQIRNNIDLLCEARDNIFSVMNELNDMPEIMKQMPPLPELNNSIFPRSSYQMNS